MPSLVFGAGLIWMASMIFFYAHGHLVKELILSQSISSIVEHGLLFPDVGCLLRYLRPVPSPESQLHVSPMQYSLQPLDTIS